MLQLVDGHRVFVVDLATMPELPIRDDGIPALKPYALALTDAIQNGIIPGPGKYGIELSRPRKNRYTIYRIDE